MARYSYHRLDANHKAIVQALEQIGASIEPKGPLDVIVGYGGANYLLEIKTAHGRVSSSQSQFLATWRGQAQVVRSISEAFAAIGISGASE